MVTASMLKFIDDPEADTRWLRLLVPGSNGGETHSYVLEVALHPLSLSASKHCILTQQQEDILVMIDRRCIFAPDAWGPLGITFLVPQPHDACCPRRKCKGKNAKKLPEALDSIPEAA